MSDRDRPEPKDDPFACSICGQPLGTVERLEGEHCRACKREYGPDEHTAKNPHEREAARR